MSDQATNAYAMACTALDQVDVAVRPDHDTLEGFHALADAIASVARQGESATSGELDHHQSTEILALCMSVSLPDSLRAEALATGIDRALWRHFAHQWLAGREDGHLQPGEWIPIGAFPKALLEEPVTSRPASLHVRAGETPHLRRFDVTPVKVRVDGRHADRIVSALQHLHALSVLHPAAPKLAPATGSLFGTAEPHDGWLAEVLALAANCPGQVGVAPELALPLEPDAVGQIARQIRRHEGIIVPGSRHEDVDGVRCNRAYVLFGGDVVGTHEKFAPFQVRGLPEGLDPADPHLTMLVAGPWRVVVLICKDGLSPDVLQVLARLGVNVVLCPAWSPKTDAFRALAEVVANHCQGVVVVANGPRVEPHDDPVGSIFGQPVRGATTVVHPRPPAPAWSTLQLGSTDVLDNSLTV